MHARRKQVKSEFLSTFCFTVERFERDTDGKLISIIERTTLCVFVSLEIILPGSWQ